jgi:hypothetical protein
MNEVFGEMNMIEVINALLAIPGSLVALDDLAKRMVGSGQSIKVDHLSSELQQNLLKLRRELVQFSEFGPQMRAWKEAHHVTSLISGELIESFKLIDRGRPHFVNSRVNIEKWVRPELATMHRPNVGSLTYLSAHSEPEMFAFVTHPNQFRGEKQWDIFIVALARECQDNLDRGQLNSLFESLERFRQYNVALNQRANNHLKEGLKELTNGIIEFRNSLSQS